MLGFQTRKKQFKEGFTLLELVIVVIIIGLLATVALPLYHRVILGARVGKARHAISLIAQAEKIYHDDHGKYLDVASGAFGKLADESGIDVTPVDHDEDWKYSVNALAAEVDAEFQRPQPERCYQESLIYNLDTGTFSDPAKCF